MVSPMNRGALAAAIGLAGAMALSVNAWAGAGPKGHAHGHGDEAAYGVHGDPAKTARVVKIVMTDAEGNMQFQPNVVEVKKGEQIRFVMENRGVLEHEFVLATVEENLAHAKAMEKNPEMEHVEPNMKRVKEKGKAEVLWRFTKTGKFQFACLIPGHMQAGMHGTVIVK